MIRNNDTPTPEEGYITGRIGDSACSFIGAHKDERFYLFVSFTSPHGPLEPREGYDDEKRLGHIEGGKRKKCAGLISAMDDNVGKILASLKKHDLEENTLVIFTNDNGGPGPNETGADNYPLRGFKGGLHEGGIRVPWAMRLPGVIAPDSVIEQPVTTLDILPTLLDFAGTEIDSGWNLNGVSLLPLLKDPTAKLPERSLYWRRNGPGGPIAIRDQDWKLVIFRNDLNALPKLYNLATDVGEANDVGSEYPEVVARLQSKLESWESELSVPLWQSNFGRMPRISN